MSADELKTKGNAAFSAGKYDEAVGLFSQAIHLDPSNHVLYSNRSGSYASQEQWGPALKDAQKCIELNPSWAKGYSRLATAKHGLQDYKGACQAYRKALQLDPENKTYREGLMASEAPIFAQLPPEEAEIVLAFRSPKFMASLATHAETRDFLQQPDFMAIYKELQEDPLSLQKHLGDPRILKCMEIVLGVKVMSKGEAAQQYAEEMRKKEEAEERRKKEEIARKKAAEEEEQRRKEEAMTPEEKEAKRRNQEACEHKERGNEAYKNRRFEEAIAHYNRAMEIDPADISFLNNRAAVYFETGQLDQCIADCDRAVELGREVRADFKLVARALTRKGSALVRQGSLEPAIEAFNKSLMEHRNPDTLKRLQEAEKALREAKENAYVDLALSNEAKDKGNALFKQAKYAEAIPFYTEALKRGPPHANPECYKTYSNRAAAYIKLGAMPEALKDAEKCIELRPDFAKGYLRKGQVQFFMKEYEKALDTYQLGLDREPENEELREGVYKAMEALNRFMNGTATEEEIKIRRERAMSDPEIQSILTDPVMRNVLRDFQENPRAAQDHLKDPAINFKLNKLVRAGIVRMG